MHFTPEDMTAATITNSAGFDFTPEMGAKYNGRPLPLRKGESMTTNLTIANHLALNLAQHVFLKGKLTAEQEKNSPDLKEAGRSLWDPKKLKEVAAQFVRTIGMEPRLREKTKEEILLENATVFNDNPDVADESKVTEGYKNKSEVIAELTKREIPFDARANKAALEKLLADES